MEWNGSMTTSMSNQNLPHRPFLELPLFPRFFSEDDRDDHHSKEMDFRVVRKYFYQKWRGHSLKNNTRREIVFLLLGAPRYALGFGNLLRLTFIRVNSVMDDDAIIGLFMDSDMAQFVKFATMLPKGEMLCDLHLPQIISIVDHDLSSLVAYLDLPRIFHEVGVDLTSAGPDPMSAPEAFYLKLLWPGYIDSDEKYVAIMIAGILATRWDLDQNSVSLPPYSMHLTEVGMHLKSLEAIDASLAWALPALKNEGLRLARFLGKSDTERYFSVTDSPCHHSDKVVSLKVPLIWKDAERLWSMHDIGLYLREGEYLSSHEESKVAGIEEHMAYMTRVCAEAALSDDRENDIEMIAADERLVRTTHAMQQPVVVRSLTSLTNVDSCSFVRDGKLSAGSKKCNNASGILDLPPKRRSPLRNLAYNASQPDFRRASSRMYHDVAQREKTIAAAPAGAEDEVENFSSILY